MIAVFDELLPVFMLQGSTNRKTVNLSHVVHLTRKKAA
jgi:hypothetical protein